MTDSNIKVGAYQWDDWTVTYDKLTGVPLLYGDKSEDERTKGRYLYDMLSFGNRFNISFTIFNYQTLQSLLDVNEIDYIENRLAQDVAERVPELSRLCQMESHCTVVSTIYNCSYEKSLEEQRQSDFAEVIYSFSTSTWLLIALIAFIISRLLQHRLGKNEKISERKRKVSGFWVFFTHIIGQPESFERDVFLDILSTTISLFCFLFIVCCFNNSIKSDKIVTYHPVVYESYEQVPNDPNIDVIVMEHAKSIHRNILNETHGRVEQNIIKVSLSDVLNIWSDTLRNERIFIESLSNTKQIQSYLCQHKLMPDLCTYVGHERINEMDDAIFMANNFKKKSMYNRYMKYFRKSMETGLRVFQRETLIYNSHPIVTPDTVQCLSEVLVTHDPELTPFELINYRFAFSVLLIPFSFALIALIHEVFKRMRIRGKTKNLWKGTVNKIIKKHRKRTKFRRLWKRNVINIHTNTE